MIAASALRPKDAPVLRRLHHRGHDEPTPCKQTLAGLILDEATSALDAVTEARIQALEEVMKGWTTFVIAHRLATIRNANLILVCEGGRITETGNFDELVRRGGGFARLAETQFLAPATAAE